MVILFTTDVMLVYNDLEKKLYFYILYLKGKVLGYRHIHTSTPGTCTTTGSLVQYNVCRFLNVPDLATGFSYFIK